MWRYTWFTKLDPFDPGTESLASDEMRVTFLGTCGYIPRLSGVASSVFVALGNGDSFVSTSAPVSWRSMPR